MFVIVLRKRTKINKKRPGFDHILRYFVKLSISVHYETGNAMLANVVARALNVRTKSLRLCSWLEKRFWVKINILASAPPPMTTSVTRFGKFCHFGKSLQVFGKFLMVYFLFDIMFSPLCQIYDTIGLIIIVANSQILKIILTIWSHCNCITF